MYYFVYEGNEKGGEKIKINDLSKALFEGCWPNGNAGKAYRVGGFSSG